MRRILDITLKDLLQNLRERETFLFLLIMPIAFTLLFGFAFGGFSSSENNDPRLPVAFIDQDQGQFSPQLLRLFEGSTVIRLVQDNESTLEKWTNQVREGDIAGALIVPVGYSAALLTGNPSPLQLTTDPSSQSATTIEREVASTVSRLVDALHTAKIIQDKSSEPTAFDNAFQSAVEAWKNPPVQLVQSESSAVPEVKSGNPFTSFTHTAPGMMVQFAIAGLLSASQVLVHEKKSRTWQRLMTTTVTRAQILTGHYLAIVALILIQFFLLIVFGQIFLKLNYTGQPLATLVMMLVTALCVGALGLLIGALAKNDDQAVIFSLVPMFLLAGLGGAWVPLEVTGATFQKIGHISLVAWVMDGFQDILVRGAGLEKVWLPAVVLVGFTVLFLVVAVIRFRRE